MERRRFQPLVGLLIFFQFLFRLLLISHSTEAQSLNCADFDNCSWLNANSPATATGSALVWFRGNTSIDPSQLQLLTGTTSTPNGTYVIASTNVADTDNLTQSALLVSNTVPCQYTNASIRFNYWTSPFVVLYVCSKLESSSSLNKAADCTRQFTQGPGPADVPILATSGPFRILIEASNFVFSSSQMNGGFAILDNLQYSGDYCRAPIATSNSTAVASNSTVTANIVVANSTLSTNSSFANASLAATTNSSITTGNATTSG